MVKTRYGSSASNRNERGQTSRTPNLKEMTADGQPIPLQVIPPLNSQPMEILRLPWKDNAEIKELNPEHMEPIHPEHSDTSGGMNMHVPPTESTTSKNPNSEIDFVKRVQSTETLINPTGGDKEGVHVDSQPLEGENVVGEKKDGESGKVSGDREAIRPSVKDTSETSYKSARTITKSCKLES
ncbi:hypothetical protein LIER_43206 [Lithospermum erythrorhizon]|uniref:Uncharacterized protein n=1 Tax=Lithospermum erythrorhizon TaxID=34254 RepID=A0AAV3PP14_LITER